MPDWWEEMVVMPHVDDHHSLTWKVHTSFEIPGVRCKALKVCNDYSSPPAPKYIGRKAFLPIPDPRIPCQDYREGQPQKTLAYAQALQYWAGKANLPKTDEQHLLARCIHELRWAFYHLPQWSCLWRNHTKAGNPGGRGHWTEHNGDQRSRHFH